MERFILKWDADCCCYVRTCGLDVLHCVYAPVLMEVRASSEFPPTSVFTDYLTAAVLASSNSFLYKRVKPNQVVALGEYDDMR